MIKIYSETIEAEALDQFYKAMSLPCNIQGALMPDAHAGYTLPIGAVIKSDSTVFPSYVGYDIGCGMCAVKTNILAKTLDLEALKANILAAVPVGFNRHTKPQTIPKHLLTLPATPFAKVLFDTIAPYQLGTLGGGNHFIELGASSDNRLQIIVHSGSRNLGKQVAEHYMKLAAIENTDQTPYEQEFDTKNRHWQARNPDQYAIARADFVHRRVRAHLNTSIEDHFGFDISSQSGQDYLTDMRLCLEFALENRKHIIDSILFCIQQQVDTFKTTRFINRNHNHAELRDSFVIHRKGATHAEAGILGVIPGNMKDGSFIVEGRGCLESLSSSSHGAGRVLSRRKAKDTLDYQDFVSSMSGIVSNHTESTIDESPLAYKNIFEVMDLQKDLVSVIEHVRPILNIKG